MIEYWIDIPNLQTVYLPDSFFYVQANSVSITSIIINSNEWIDVSTILADLFPILYSCDYVESIDSNVTLIHLSDRICNEVDYTTFNFSRFNILEELVIGNNSFMYVNEFVIDGLNELKSLIIGNNSFTQTLDSYGNDKSRSFSISNCDELKSIEIGRYSFSDYSGLFELVNLPKLESIKIGEIGSTSNNFYWSSFVIKGMIELILLMNRSSTFEFHWTRW